MSEDRPRIVIMPGNDAVSDARVLKNLATADALGMDAWAIGVRKGGGDETFSVGGATIRIISVPSLPAQAGAARWRGRFIRALSPGYAGAALRRVLRAYAARVARRLQRRLAVRHHAHAPAIPDAEPTVARSRPSLRPPTASTRAWAAVGSRLTEPSTLSAATPANQEARERRIRRLTRGPRHIRWRAVHTRILDYEAALVPLLRELEPDVIHVHDVFMMSVATKAAADAARGGRTIHLVYDAREYLRGLAHIDTRLVAGYVDLERECLPRFDAVVTVSDELADWLVRDHHLAQRPAIVYNAPAVNAAGSDSTIREDLGLPRDVPIAVYAGGVNPARGVQTAVDVLPLVPSLHVALIANGRSAVVIELEERAVSLGVADRFHVLPFVDAEDVVPYLSTATIGLSTLLHAPNHDIALTNKFCEYIAAGLAVVTSDTPSQQRFVDELGLGSVYAAGDPSDLARAIRDVLADESAIRERVAAPDVRHRFSWDAQAEVLRDLYVGLVGALPAKAWLPGATHITHITPKETKRR